MLGCDTLLHDNLKCSVVPGLHDGGVMLVVKCCAAKVDESDLGVLEDPDLPALLPVLLADVVLVVVAVEEQDVLWLQVCVGQTMIMKEVHRETQLIGDLSHVLDGVRVVVVVFEEDEHTLALNQPLWEAQRGGSHIPRSSNAMTCGRGRRTSCTSRHTCM